MPDYQCPNCSRPVAADATFCSNCGARLTLTPKAPPVTPTDPTVVAWAVTAASGSGQAPKPWWKRWWGIAAIGLAILLILGGIGSVINGGRTQGGAASPGASLAVGAVSTPTATVRAVTAEPTEAATPEPTEEATPEPTEEATPEPLPPVKAASYATPSSRQWAQIVKAPDNYLGNGYHIWACITQFDAATGTDSFRAQASYKKQEFWYSDGDNTFFAGDEAQLAATSPTTWL